VVFYYYYRHQYGFCVVTRSQTVVLQNLDLMAKTDMRRQAERVESFDNNTLSICLHIDPHFYIGKCNVIPLFT
jgi:hypothetical protein